MKKAKYVSATRPLMKLHSLKCQVDNHLFQAKDRPIWFKCVITLLIPHIESIV